MADRTDDGASTASIANVSESADYDATEDRTSALQQRIQRQLQSRTDRGICRQLTRFDPTVAGNPSRVGIATDADLIVKCSFAPAVPGQQESRWIDFSSNDYLSFATLSELKQRYFNRLHTWHASNPTHPLASSRGSRLLDGNLGLSEEIERQCASHFRSSDALLFNTGFSANVSLVGSLPHQGDVVLYDELIHASMHDGLRRSRARGYAFKHSDPADLRRLVQSVALPLLSQVGNSTPSTVFVAVEGVYSMDGDICPLPLMVEAIEAIPRRQRCLVVDEAHSVGVYGPQGRGIAAAWGMEDHVDIRLVTFGKALGASGAVVLCDHWVKQYLINYARPLIFSTALPPTVLLAMQNSIEALQLPLYTQAQQTVLSTARSFRQTLGIKPCAGVRLAQLAWTKAKANTKQEGPHESLLFGSPIVPFLVPHAKALAAYLQSYSLIVRGITYPSVPQGQNRVRICLHAGNDPTQVKHLTTCLTTWISSNPDRIDSHTGSAPSSKL